MTRSVFLSGLTTAAAAILCAVAGAAPAYAQASAGLDPGTTVDLLLERGRG